MYLKRFKEITGKPKRLTLLLLMNWMTYRKELALTFACDNGRVYKNG
jgi:hypothetical protein